MLLTFHYLLCCDLCWILPSCCSKCCEVSQLKVTQCLLSLFITYAERKVTLCSVRSSLDSFENRRLVTKMTRQQIINCEKWVLFGKYAWLPVHMGIDRNKQKAFIRVFCEKKSTVYWRQQVANWWNKQVIKIPSIVTNHMQGLFRSL